MTRISTGRKDMGWDKILTSLSYHGMEWDLLLTTRVVDIT